MTITINPDKLEQLDRITLGKGFHAGPDDGMCVMEAVAWVHDAEWTDKWDNVSPVLGEFCRCLNDRWEVRPRQKLKPFVTRLPGTADDGQDEARSYLALDWLVRTYTPAWLDLAGLTNEAAVLRAHRPITNTASAKSAHTLTVAARDVAAFIAGPAVSWDVWASGRNVTEGAAWVAAWVATRNAPGDAARDAAVSAAEDAEWVGAGLKLTVEELHASALGLLDRMIDPRVTA